MSEFTKRILAGVVLMPIALFLVLYENFLPLGVAIFVLIILGNLEMFRLMHSGGEPVNKIIALLGAFVFPLCFIVAEKQWKFFDFTLAALIIFTFLLKMFSDRPTEGVVRYISSNLFCALFVPFFMSFVWQLRLLINGEYWLLFLLVTIWISDSSAYFVGRKIGSIKIVPKISPKKSLQGFISGILFGTLGGFVFYYFVIHKHSNMMFIKVLIMAFSVVISGMLGDLFESMMKRDAGIKDSGNLIPGHGGVLDRFDSIIISAPILYIYLNAWL